MLFVFPYFFFFVFFFNDTATTEIYTLSLHDALPISGHAGANASFAIGHPEKVIDFAYRAVHEMAVKSKAIIAAFYDCAPRFSYWTGCSTGGRQALMEAQRYPEDFDGIIAGAPANNQTQLCAWRIAVEARILQSPASVVPRAKLALLNRAVLAACDAIDVLKDGLLTDPLQCHFDPATPLCHGADRDDCLTAQQIEAVKMGYAPAMRKTGELIYPGLVPGGETGWAMLTGAKPEPGSIDVGMFTFVAHEDPAWDWRTFDLDRDTSLIDKKAGFIDAVNPDLSAFRARGRKLLIFHGWNDGGSGGAISPQNTVNYYSSVLAKMGSQQQDWLRLFMVPGMEHCGGGPGPDQVNWMAALERWRESGIAPDRLIASQVRDNRVKHDTATLSLSTSRALRRPRQHERRGKPRVPGALISSLSGLTGSQPAAAGGSASKTLGRGPNVCWRVIQDE